MVNSVVEGRSVLSSLGSLSGRSRVDNFRRVLALGTLGTSRHKGIVTDEVGVDTVTGVDVNLVMSVGSHKGSKGHDVGRKSTSLVGANDSHTSKSLDGRKCADNSIVLCHVGYGVSVCDSDNGLETFGNHGDGGDKRNGDSINGGIRR